MESGLASPSAMHLEHESGVERKTPWPSCNLARSERSQRCHHLRQTFSHDCADLLNIAIARVMPVCMRFRTHHYTVWSINSTNETFDWGASGLAAACLNEWVSIDASRHIHMSSLLCRCPECLHSRAPTVTAGPRHRRRVVPRRARRERRRERA